ncbi:MAG: ribonuclease R [Calditrichaeota bacterium]|nr:MAG: ribonuclease R [Calditrichota bacterium]
MKRKFTFYKKNIIKTLEAQPHRLFKTKELAQLLKIAPAEYSELRTATRRLADENLISKYKSNRFRALKPSSVLEGKIEVKAQGFAFLLMPEGEEDIFIGPGNIGLALDGDLVKVQLFASAKGRRKEGRVVKVVERQRRYIVGLLKQGKHYYYLVPDDPKIKRDIFVHESDLNGAKEGQKVAVEIDYWEDEWMNPEGHVSTVLGYPGDVGVDVLSVVTAFNLPLTFPKKVEHEAAKRTADIPQEVINSRLDLRDQMCFTIDPPDAKDFDDAVSLEHLDSGNWQLGVHIADVSYYVKQGDTVDTEARERGTSVYLVDRVIPMLPEHLSNTLCSLQPLKDRLAYSCIMEVTPAGDVISYKIMETVIRSKRRFTYQEVQKFWDNKKDIEPEFIEPLNAMATLSRTLRHNRFRHGSLRFETPEAQVILDKKGVPVEIKRRESLASMQMIEEFMLLANQTVTEYIESLKTEYGTPPFVYRNHDKPDSKKMGEFIEFLGAIGVEHKLGGRMTSSKLSRFMNSIAGSDKENIIQSILLRSLMKARYETMNIGHFGLAFKRYTHFTSPIRRYPDLEVHRTLKNYMRHGWTEEKREALTKRIEDSCDQSNERELVALSAERASIKMKKVEYMQAHLGDEFDGIISGVVHFGLFVELTDFLVEGLVHISDLHDDIYEYDDKSYTLHGTTTGVKFRLGDNIRVKVVRADPHESVIDLLLIDGYKKKRVNKDKTNKKRKKNNKNRSKNHLKKKG